MGWVLVMYVTKNQCTSMTMAAGALQERRQGYWDWRKRRLKSTQSIRLCLWTGRARTTEYVPQSWAQGLHRGTYAWAGWSEVTICVCSFLVLYIIQWNPSNLDTIEESVPIREVSLFQGLKVHKHGTWKCPVFTVHVYVLALRDH